MAKLLHYNFNFRFNTDVSSPWVLKTRTLWTYSNSSFFTFGGLGDAGGWMTWSCALVAQKSIHDLAASKAAWPREQRTWFWPSTPLWGNPTWSASLSSGVPSTERSLYSWTRSRGRPQKQRAAALLWRQAESWVYLGEDKLQGDLAAFEYLKGAYRN